MNDSTEKRRGSRVVESSVEAELKDFAKHPEKYGPPMPATQGWKWVRRMVTMKSTIGTPTTIAQWVWLRIPSDGEVTEPQFA